MASTASGGFTLQWLKELHPAWSHFLPSLPTLPHTLKGYWEDIGTIESFYHANLALTNPATAQFR